MIFTLMLDVEFEQILSSENPVAIEKLGIETLKEMEANGHKLRDQNERKIQRYGLRSKLSDFQEKLLTRLTERRPFAPS